MKALTWQGVNQLAVENVPDPRLLNAGDAIVKVNRTVTCGSDLHLVAGHIPFMRAGDVIGHEFVGEIVETGPDVHHHVRGDRVVVCSFVACGRCSYCQRGLYSCCDNTNAHPAITETMWGSTTGGCFGYSHSMGGFAGSHAQYVRVPFADYGAFRIPDGVSDERAVFASDSAPTGWMGAEQGGVKPGDIVAVWGAGAVGQMAARAAILLGAERVIIIDRCDYRLELARRYVGAEPLSAGTTDINAELLERTGGRGADVCIEAVGMQPTGSGAQAAYDEHTQKLRIETDRPVAVREAIHNCRKGGSVFILGVFTGLVDGFPLGAVMNKGLSIRSAQQHGHRYIPMLLDRMARGELVTEHLATHTMPLDDGPDGYKIFSEKTDGCLRTVFTPN